MDEFRAVQRLAAEGLNISQISRGTSIPRTTIRTWLGDGFHARTSDRPACRDRFSCRDRLPSSSYAYLLGLYLGDGWIARIGPRGVFKLHIYCASAYPRIVAECSTAIRKVLPANKVGSYKLPDAAMIIVSSYSKHWPHLFPQHGPGMKHTRPIVLEPWQRSIVEARPEQLIRGLLHSDGCRVVNRVTRRAKRYEYPRYFFSNVSDDIRGIFCDALDRLDIAWRQDGRHVISVARRDAVASLDTFVGPKS